MSAEFSSKREEGSLASGPSFRSNQRKILNLLLERDASFSISSDLPTTPVEKKLFGDSANLSILSGGTPKRRLDLSNLSSGEMSATQLTASADFDETGHLESTGPEQVQLAQLFCSTPNALDHGRRKKDTICGSSANKENVIAQSCLTLCDPMNRSTPGLPVHHQLPEDNGNLVESEMKHLGSPITTVSKLHKNPELAEYQAEEVPDELMEFSLEDQEKVCALPTVSGKHQDLKYVNPETVAALLSGEFQGLIEKFYIIDCRYPYEYLGGHIQGALNLYSQEELYNFFLKKPIVPLDNQKRIVIVFHCEFSSERGPRMCHSLREEDRALNQYPALYYPELYILKGGYRDFFPEYMELCEPQSYCPMHHQDHKAELLRCRNQIKAWEGERQLQAQIALLVKDVSP
uniref:M-phase inducer phosphatase n=1 Tax=Capra hircus TaxID=9925 RepID=A0A452FZQ8_CAPHI